MRLSDAEWKLMQLAAGVEKLEILRRALGGEQSAPLALFAALVFCVHETDVPLLEIGKRGRNTCVVPSEPSGYRITAGTNAAIVTASYGLGTGVKVAGRWQELRCRRIPACRRTR